MNSLAAFVWSLRPLVVECVHGALPLLPTQVPVVQQPFCLFGQVYPDCYELPFHLDKQIEMLLLRLYSTLTAN